MSIKQAEQCNHWEDDEDDWWMFPNDFWISQRNARAAGSGVTVKISWVLCAGHLRVYAGMMRNFFRSANSDVVIQIKPMKTWWHANSTCVSHVSSCILDVDHLLWKCAGSFAHYFLLMHHPALCRQKSSDPCSKDVILYLNTRISPWSVSVETFYVLEWGCSGIDDWTKGLKDSSSLSFRKLRAIIINLPKWSW